MTSILTYLLLFILSVANCNRQNEWFDTFNVVDRNITINLVKPSDNNLFDTKTPTCNKLSIKVKDNKLLYSLMLELYSEKEIDLYDKIKFC